MTSQEDAQEPVEPEIVAELRRWTRKGPNQETNTIVVDYIDDLQTYARTQAAEVVRLRQEISDLNGQLEFFQGHGDGRL